MVSRQLGRQITTYTFRRPLANGLGAANTRRAVQNSDWLATLFSSTPVRLWLTTVTAGKAGTGATRRTSCI